MFKKPTALSGDPKARGPRSVVIFALFILCFIPGTATLAVLPAPPESQYLPAFLLIAASVFFIWFLFRVIEHSVRAVVRLVPERSRGRVIPPLVYHAACLATTLGLIGVVALWLRERGNLSPARTSQQLRNDVADRVPVNHPNGPKTYPELTRYLGLNTLTEYEKQMIPMALVEIVKRAEKAGDMDLLGALMECDDHFVQDRASAALEMAPPTTATLLIAGRALNDADADRQLLGIDLLYNAATPLDFKTKGDLPGCPGFALFKKDHEHWITLWRAWWEANREAMLAKTKATENLQ